MSDYESPIEANEKSVPQLLRLLNRDGFVWGNYNKETNPNLLLEVITEAVYEQGGIHELGNLEEVLTSLAKSTDPDYSEEKLKKFYRLSGKPEIETVINTIEAVVRTTGSLSEDLENSYIDNLERYYANSIKACEQDSGCINELLEEITKRAIASEVDGEKIQELIRKINKWAYLPEVA